MLEEIAWVVLLIGVLVLGIWLFRKGWAAARPVMGAVCRFKGELMSRSETFNVPRTGSLALSVSSNGPLRLLDPVSVQLENEDTGERSPLSANWRIEAPLKYVLNRPVEIGSFSVDKTGRYKLVLENAPERSERIHVILKETVPREQKLLAILGIAVGVNLTIGSVIGLVMVLVR